MRKKMKGFLMAAFAATMLFGTTLTSEAAPKTMPDGQIFDAQFYAQSYPDVVAAFGNDENLLYSHYVSFGKSEGRLPYAGAQGAADTQGTGMADTTIKWSMTVDDLGGGNQLIYPLSYSYPAGANVVLTDIDVINVAKQLFPEGSQWGMEKFYDKISYVKGEGKWINGAREEACGAFAFWLTDSIYGNIPMNCYRLHTAENPSPVFEYCMYDIVVFETPETAKTGISHAGVIIGADPATQTLYLASGNYGGKVTWKLPLKVDGSDGNMIGMVFRRVGVTP
ncbi:MAG: hypothetical protein HDR12_08930 [Lachnospiraceae bacterium]|nr:hypothetical protein [Lachnospiraceae bacterium]